VAAPLWRRHGGVESSATYAGRADGRLNSRGAVPRRRVEARTAFISSVRRVGTAHRGDRRSDGGLSGRQTLRMAGTWCEERGGLRGVFGARDALGRHAASACAQPGSRGRRRPVARPWPSQRFAKRWFGCLNLQKVE
jgi:hypothetical protein